MLIPRTFRFIDEAEEMVPGNRSPLKDELASYQVVGGVIAYQA